MYLVCILVYLRELSNLNMDIINIPPLVLRLDVTAGRLVPLLILPGLCQQKLCSEIYLWDRTFRSGLTKHPTP